MGEVKRNLIAGRWVTGDTTIENRNPSDLGDLIGTYAQASAAQLDETLAAARIAQAEWAGTGIERRQAVLMAIGNELMARAEELGRLLSREEGKPLAEGRGEVYRAGQFFTYYAAETLRQIGDTADSVRAGVEIDVRREPVGTVAIVSPWNFPTATAAWKIAPALAFGHVARGVPGHHQRHAHQHRGDVRAAGRGDPRGRLRRGARHRQRHPLRTDVGHRDEEPRPGGPLSSPCPHRLRHGQPRHRRYRLPRAVRRAR